MVYEQKSRLTPQQQGRLIEYFVAGATAHAAASLLRIQPNTAIAFFMRLRKLVASKVPSYQMDGEVEADESYFGGHRKGKRGRGASGKVAVFGLLKRKGKVYTAIIPNAQSVTLLPIIEQRIAPDSIVYTDTPARTTYSMSPSSGTCASTTPSCSPTRKTTSTESRASGTRPNAICDDSTA